MADQPLDLTGDIALAVDGAALRNSTLVVGYVGDDGFAALSFRGSTQVHSRNQLAFWARNPNDGIVKVIAQRPQISLLYYGGGEGPGPRYLSFQGRAHVDPTASDAVYDKMIEGEQAQDPHRKGVAVIIDVDSVRGFGDDGPFGMQREG
jgi:hypothetical protein